MAWFYHWVLVYSDIEVLYSFVLSLVYSDIEVLYGFVLSLGTGLF